MPLVVEKSVSATAGGSKARATATADSQVNWRGMVNGIVD